MPIYNVTIDDASPLIQYARSWGDSSHSDTYWSSYSNQTFHATEAWEGTATVTFNGSAVYIFGAKRPNHDWYTVKLDDTLTSANGFSGSTSKDLFNYTLFSQTGLDRSRQHKLVLQNAYTTSYPSWVDLDFIVITTGDGNENTQSEDTTCDDDYATYSSGWQASSNSSYYNHTMHRTDVVNASATITFTGNALSVFGATATDHGFFSVSLDGADPLVLNGTVPPDNDIRYQNLLYWAGGLSSGQEHNVVFTNLNGTWLDLDKFVVSTWPQSNTNGSISNGPASIPTPTPTSPRSNGDAGGSNGGSVVARHPPAGIIAGGVVAGVAVVTFIALGIVFLYRCQRSRLEGDEDSLNSATSYIALNSSVGTTHMYLPAGTQAVYEGGASSRPHLQDPPIVNEDSNEGSSPPAYDQLTVAGSSQTLPPPYTSPHIRTSPRRVPLRKR